MGWSGGTTVAERFWDLVKDKITTDEYKEVAQGIIDILTDEDWDCVNEAEELCEAAGMKKEGDLLEYKLLHNNSGSSDKSYEVNLYEISSDGDWYIEVEYGRRGSNLKKERKGTYSDLDDARLEYYKIIKLKKAKGYKEVG